MIFLSAERILADFINYLYASTKTYIKEPHPGGPAFWKSVEYVLSLPNGWEGQQINVTGGRLSGK
jgi:hypothetical protein